MESFLLLVIFIAYSELALCKLTRSIGRILYYTHTMAILVPMYSPTDMWALINGMLIYIFGFVFCASFSETIQGKALFIVLSALTVFIYVAALTYNPIDIIIFGYSVASNSDTIFRWCLFMAIGCCSSLVNKQYKVQQRDVELSIGCFTLMWVVGG